MVSILCLPPSSALRGVPHLIPLALLPRPPWRSGMCRIRVLERLHSGPLALVECERPGHRLLAHRRTESQPPPASLLTPLPPSAGEATPARPSPAHLSLPPPSAGCWPPDLPAAPTPATLLRVSVTARAPEIARGLGSHSPTGEL